MFTEHYYTGTTKDGIKVVVCKLSGCSQSLRDDLDRKNWSGHNCCFGGPFELRDVFEGKAKCSPEDTYDEELGKKIAKKRALAKLAREKKQRLTWYMDYVVKDYTKCMTDLSSLMEKYQHILECNSNIVL